MTRLVPLLLILAITLGCNKDTDDPRPDFNKAALLTNISGEIILPSIGKFSADLDNLSAAFNQFSLDETQVNFEGVQEAIKTAYLTWQTVKIFDFGPIRTNGIKSAIGTYPSDTAVIASYIATGSYNLSSLGNVDAIGLSALDYLFFKQNALNELQTSANYLTYAGDVVAKMVAEFAVVTNQWTTYKATFDASTGTSSTSAFSEFVNEFNRDFELAKNAKIGVPFGKQSLGIQLPEYIEARYSGISLDLLEESIRALQKVYNGVGFTTGADGPGFDDYLIHLEKSNLDSTIDMGFNGIINKTNSFTNTLEQEMAVSVPELDVLYSLLQGHVVHIKTDMTSSFGVLITYQDNDGD
ncbi:MAG: imelysin family protein [Crocinitomicaceae bacterium]|nr:imelysin family protein [Crocinitomicaceae bacterium]